MIIPLYTCFKLFLFYCYTFKESYYDDRIKSNIYYSAPSFGINYANVTFGTARLNLDRPINGSIITLGNSVATICQAELINQNKTKFSINGIINVLFQEYSSFQSSGQAAIETVLGSNFYASDSFSNNNSRPYEANITGLFGISDYGTARINSMTSNQLSIPFISAGDLARSNPDNQFSGYFPAENTTFFQILNTVNYSTFDAVLQVLLRFNWTLVGNVFEANSFGYKTQERVSDYSSKNRVPIFTCRLIYYFELGAEFESSQIDISLKLFCQCVAEKSVLNVIALWMSTSASIVFVTQLKKICKQAKDWTFIVADDYQTPINRSPDSKNLKNSLILRNNGPWNFEGFVQECLENADKKNKETIKSLLNSYLLLAYNCKLKEEDEIIKLSESSNSNSSFNETCRCDPKILEQDPYASKYFFAADIMSTYAQGISMLQNNCTLLNEKLANNTGQITTSNVDFCKITTFTPKDLAFALRFVNFTGYTGEIYFSDDSLARSVKTYYLYNVYNDKYDAALVGVLNENHVNITDSQIQFVNGEIPTSSIVPQNPDLSYAVVDVFFGIAILELVTCLTVLVIFIIYRDCRCIRKTSPYLSLVILVGITLIALALMLECLGATDALCTLNLYLTRFMLVVVLQAVLVKNYRIYRIFTNKRAVSISISEGRLLLFVFIGSIFYLGILTIFVAVFGYKAVVLRSEENIFYEYVRCVIPNDTWDTLFNYFVEFYILILLILALISAWLTRNVYSDYNESQAVTAFIAVATVLFSILNPLALSFKDETDSQIFRFVINAEVTSIFILCGLAFLFLPKVYMIYREKKSKSD